MESTSLPLKSDTKEFKKTKLDISDDSFNAG